MEIQINAGLLSDAPFNESNRDIFRSIVAGKNDLIEDIMQGQSICALISGYKGAGKTSLVYQIKDDIYSRMAPIEGQELIFVHVNFSHFHKKEFLLRKLIRSLYHQLQNTVSFSGKRSWTKWWGFRRDACFEMAQRLYDRTFYDSSELITESTQKEKSKVFNFDFFTIPRILLAFSALGLFIIYRKPWELPIEKIISYGVSAFSASVLALAAISLVFRSQIVKSQKNEWNRKSIYDEEIADYHLLDFLYKLKPRYKVVFVLDEIDKLPENHRQELLDVMKPYFLSGTSSYIVVAGQSLFYKYAATRNADDEMLTTLFSRFVHVPLISRIELRALLINLIKNYKELPGQIKTDLLEYCEYLVFESRRVPRRFITLIRQQVYYENKVALFNINKTSEELEAFKICNDFIDEIEKDRLKNTGLEGAMVDFCVMQLYIMGSTILRSTVNFDLDILLSNESSTGISHVDKMVQPLLAEYYELLFAHFEKNKIIIQVDKKIDKRKRVYRLSILNLNSSIQKGVARNVFRDILNLRNAVSQIVNIERDSSLGKLTNFADQMLMLEKLQVISMQWGDRDEILRTFSNLENLLNDPEIEDNFTTILINNKVDIHGLYMQVLEYYGQKSIQKVFNENLTNVSSDPLIDLTLRNNSQSYPLQWYFKFSYRIEDPVPEPGVLLQILQKVELLPENTHLMLIVFTQANQGQYEKWQFLFRQNLRDLPEGAALKHRISFVPVSTGALQLMEDYLQGEINQDKIQRFDHVFLAQTPLAEYPERNDDFLSWTYDISFTDIDIEINPMSSKFWRFGFAFSTTPDFPDRNRRRQADTNFGHVQICVGQPNHENAWQRPGYLDLTSDYVNVILNEFKQLDDYNGGQVRIKMRRLDYNGETEFTIFANDKNIGKKIIALQMFRYVRLSAWADFISFRIESRITLTFRNINLK